MCSCVNSPSIRDCRFRSIRLKGPMGRVKSCVRLKKKSIGRLACRGSPPELREDRGEVQAARQNKLPRLIEVRDIKADLQVHSNWSDGKLTMLEMARAAAKRGIKVIAFTDHSVSLGVTGGLSMEDHKKQAAEIRKTQDKLGDSILILHASEVEIKADGTLDYPDKFLASLDLVLASLHTSLRQPCVKVTNVLA